MGLIHGIQYFVHASENIQIQDVVWHKKASLNFRTSGVQRNQVVQMKRTKR